MAGETTITIVGNLTEDLPPLHPVRRGRCELHLASTPRTFNRQTTSGKTARRCYVCSIWRDAAENVASRSSAACG